MKLLISSLFALCCMLFSSPAAQIDVHSLNIIYKMIDSSKTQADMNYYSFQLSRFWSDRVQEIENKISQSMKKRERAKFKNSMKSWRSHVDDMSSIRSALFKKDFMAPRYYEFNAFESALTRAKKGSSMQSFIYNMSKALYYEDKWVELDILFNSN